MKNSKWRQAQDEQMDAYTVRMTAKHARHFRQRGLGNLSEGVRTVGEKDAGEFVDRRGVVKDRRKK
jgi:hypothetical protein